MVSVVVLREGAGMDDLATVEQMGGADDVEVVVHVAGDVLFCVDNFVVIVYGGVYVDDRRDIVEGDTT